MIIDFPETSVDPDDEPFTLRITDSGNGDLKVYEENDVVRYAVNDLVIGDEHYPITQFVKWQWMGECDDAWHYHASSGHAINSQLLRLTDPENCRYGSVRN